MLAMLPITVLAQDDDEDSEEREASRVEEVVVTAQRREEAIMDVPMAISALSDVVLDRSDILDISDLQAYVPGLSAEPFAGGGGTLFLRGIGVAVGGVGVDPNVALYRDGVHVPRHAIAFQNFADVKRVEVLRGPQGTLYGRNSTGGAIRVITRDATEQFEARARYTTGDYGRQGGYLALSGPLAGERLLGRVSLSSERQRLHMYNTFRDERPFSQDSENVTGMLEWRPADNVSVSLRGDWEEDGAAGVSARRVTYLSRYRVTRLPWNGEIPTIPDHYYENNIDHDLRDRGLKTYGGGLTIDWELDNGYSFQSITGYRDIEAITVYDGDGLNGDFSQYWYHDIRESVSQEFQLLSPLGNRYDWIIGGYIYADDGTGRGRFGGRVKTSTYLPSYTGVSMPGINYSSRSNFDSTVETDAWAVFGELTLNLTPTWRGVVGLRVSRETKDFTTTSDLLRRYEGPQDPVYTSGDPLGQQVLDALAPAYNFDFVSSNSDKAEFNAVTPRFSLQYRPDESSLYYFTISKGFKSGGFNANDVGAINTLVQAYLFNLRVLYKELRGLNLSFGTELPPGADLSNLYQDSFDGETLWSYELGWKAELADGRVSIASNAYYYDYQDLQVQSFISDVDLGFKSLISNAADARIFGAEIELASEPMDDLDLNISVGYASSEYKNFSGVADAFISPGAWDLDITNAIDTDTEGIFDASGQELLRTPEWKVVAGGQYIIDLGGAGRLIPRLEFLYQSDVWYALTDVESMNDPRVAAQMALRESQVDLRDYPDGLELGTLRLPRGGGYSRANARLTWISRTASWTVSAWLNNLTDEKYETHIYSNESGGQSVYVAAPRTFGATVTYSFR